MNLNVVSCYYRISHVKKSHKMKHYKSYTTYLDRRDLTMPWYVCHINTLIFKLRNIHLSGTQYSTLTRCTFVVDGHVMSFVNVRGIAWRVRYHTDYCQIAVLSTITSFILTVVSSVPVRKKTQVNIYFGSAYFPMFRDGSMWNVHFVFRNLPSLQNTFLFQHS